MVFCGLCLQILVVISLALLGPFMMVSDGPVLLGHKQWAENKKAFKAAFASGNSMQVAELQAGAR